MPRFGQRKIILDCWFGQVIIMLMMIIIIMNIIMIMMTLTLPREKFKMKQKIAVKDNAKQNSEEK